MLPALTRRRQVAPSIQSAHIPAPIGGINTVDAGSAMPATDCVYLYNMIAAEYGLRSRLGYKEWVTGGTGATVNEVRSVVGFSGSDASGSADALFFCTQSGIWDATTSTTSPTRLVTFGTQTGDAGYCTSQVCSTPAGRFLLLCDEENGLYVYPESTETWVKVSSDITQEWANGTDYEVGNKVALGGKSYTCTTAGTSGATGPSGTGTGISDGTVVWDYVGVPVSTAIGPSLADQNNSLTADPANFAFVTTWKSRVWLVEKGSSRAWYLDANSVYGTATSFDFGAKMKSGGPLVGLYNWSYDGGDGLDTLLVGISSSGDVVIYQGTNPNSADTFGLVGCWHVGGVPYGRRIATDYGGDVLVLSLLGVIPLSKLVIGNSVLDRSQYVTYKISNIFNLLASTYKTLRGWSVHLHPTDNALLITVPQNSGQATIQLAMSFATKGWSQYRDLPIFSAGVWNGQLYFGTTDGRVCINEGYVDGVELADPNSYTPVAWSLLTAYQNQGNALQKQVRMIRPTLLAETPNPVVSATARYNFNISEPSAPVGSGVAAQGTWDNAIWDTDIWGGEYTPDQLITGGAGMGRDVAIAIRGNAITRTTLVGVDLFYATGGLL